MKKFISWNVNGLRACINKGFYEFLEKEKPDILGLQETKMQENQIQIDDHGYHLYWNSAIKKGYSGNYLSSPHVVTKAISRAVNSRRPHSRYRTGLMSHSSVFFHTILPDRWWDAILRRIMRIKL